MGDWPPHGTTWRCGRCLRVCACVFVCAHVCMCIAYDAQPTGCCQPPPQTRPPRRQTKERALAPPCTLVPCSPGSYCPNATAQLACPRNHYCKRQSVQPRKCSVLLHCPEVGGRARATAPLWSSCTAAQCSQAAAAAMLFWHAPKWQSGMAAVCHASMPHAARTSGHFEGHCAAMAVLCRLGLQGTESPDGRTLAGFVMGITAAGLLVIEAVSGGRRTKQRAGAGKKEQRQAWRSPTSYLPTTPRYRLYRGASVYKCVGACTDIYTYVGMWRCSCTCRCGGGWRPG